MKKCWCSVLLFFISATCVAQPDSAFRLVKTIPLAAADIATDNLDNLYLLTTTDGLKKYNAAGDSVAVYNDVRRFGKLHSFDVSNPLKPLLFYKDFSTLVLLDRQLSPRTTIDLRRQNILQVSAVSLAYDNNIWLFDALENKLKKINDNGELLFETADFRTLFNEAFVPQKIIDSENSVYLFTPLFGVLQFDYYGTFQKKHVLPNWQTFALLNKKMTGTTSTGIALFNTSSFTIQQQHQFPSSFGSFNQYLVGNARLIARSKDSVNIYSFQVY